jgi:hypothetical protein
MGLLVFSEIIFKMYSFRPSLLTEILGNVGKIRVIWREIGEIVGNCGKFWEIVGNSE